MEILPGLAACLQRSHSFFDSEILEIECSSTLRSRDLILKCDSVF